MHERENDEEEQPELHGVEQHVSKPTKLGLIGTGRLIDPDGKLGDRGRRNAVRRVACDVVTCGVGRHSVT